MIDKDKYINYLIKENCILIEKINKAIEYIKEHTDNTNFIEVLSNELLEILGDKDD